MTKRTAIALIALLIVAACGKKGPLEPRPQSFGASGTQINHGR
jgi:predicted small lipoprotein YifL